MRDRNGGAGGTSGVRFRTPAGIGRGLEGWFPHAMAGHGTQWQARRAPPEAVLIGKRRDPPLPVTGITGTGHTSKATGDSTARASLGEPGVIVPVAIAEEERRQGRYRVL